MIQSELAKVLDTGKVSVGGLIDRLEEAGLVHRRADAGDRRVKRIFITDQGFDLLDRIAVVGGELDQKLFGDVADKELETAIDVLMRVKANLRMTLLGVEGDDVDEGAHAEHAARVSPFRSEPKRARTVATGARRRP